MPWSRSCRVELIAVVRVVADQVLRLRFDHVEVESQLHERHLVMVRRVRGHRQRQAVTIHNRHDFHAFSASRWPNLLPAALRRGERRINVAFRLIDLALPHASRFARSVSAARITSFSHHC